MTEQHAEKLAGILKIDKRLFQSLIDRMNAVSKKEDVVKIIMERNALLLKDRLLTLGVSSEASAKEVYDALISKIEADDLNFFEALGRPSISNNDDCERVLKLVGDFAKPPRGFFLKHEKAIEFLRNEPPKKVMEYLQYESVDDMLAHEDLYEVFSSLRIIEGNEWLNKTFFKQYQGLTPDDFEEREIIIKVLSEKWKIAAGSFVAKKWHNISHLKEMGVVFVIPIALGVSGELLRMISLVFHYLHEIPFYAGRAKLLMHNPETFARNYISLLRGDVPESGFQFFDAEGRAMWLVVQRYLTKDDENDWRLSMPRINPEALHWEKATHDIVEFSKTVDGFSKEMAFWEGLDSVGDYFKDELGNQTLVSFNIVDTVMSLVMEKYLLKYFYHQKEAMWNEIFKGFFGLYASDEYSEKYLLEGHFYI